MNGTSHGFAAELFHPELGHEVVTGTIYIEPETLFFRSDTSNLEIPLARLTAKLDETSGRIYFQDPEAPGLRVFTADESILNFRVGGQHGFIRKLLEQQASSREFIRRLRITGYVLAAGMMLSWLVVCATHFMVRSLVSKVPPEWEQKFGEQQLVELNEEGLLLQDSNRVAKLAALVAPLMQVVPGGTAFKFHIAQSDVPNAFALPGGHIVVNTGLLNLADNDELVGVIAHESAHITQKHHARKIISAAGPLILCGIFMNRGGGVGGLLGEGSGMLLLQGFSQEYETEADEVGWKYLVQANIDPRGMIGIFRKFKAVESKENHAHQMPQAFESHPALEKRIARLEAKWKKLSRQSGFLKLEAFP